MTAPAAGSQDGSASVLIVRSRTRDRTVLLDLLDRHGICALETGSGEEAVAMVARERPAVVLLEVELSDVAGYEVCRRLREEHGEELAIIFLSAARTASFDLVAGLLIGADDYVVEPFEPDELVARVRRCLSRSPTHISDRVAATAATSLTSRERDVLELLAAGLRQKQIARELVISPRTVGTHIQRILAKLDVHSRTEAVARAYRDGLVPQAAASSHPDA